jgi:hypothetical protein
MSSTTEWYRKNPDKAKEHNKKYLSDPENLAKYKEYKAQWYQENKKRKKEQLQDKTKTPYEHVKKAIQNRKNVVKGRLDFDICVDDLKIPTHCPILGIELTFGKGIKVRETAATLDRIDSSKGYVKGNVQIISYRANRIKNDASLEELIKIGEWAKNELS